jgi:tetratricopeptide (TPR) repeat protein
LYAPAGNKKGIGACENNLSAIFLSIGDSENAERHCNAAIRNATDIVQSLEQAAAGAAGGDDGAAARDLLKAKQTLSDRKGNLVVIYLQQKRFVEAFRVLEEVLVQDRSDRYFRGLVVKHGTLGHYYLKQGELESAERVFLRALDFIHNREEHGGLGWSNEVLPSTLFLYLYFIFFTYTNYLHIYARICMYVCMYVGTRLLRADSALQHSHSGSSESIQKV